MKPVRLLTVLAVFILFGFSLNAASVTVTVDAMTMPWLWNTATLNSGFQFGIQDGIDPTVVDSNSGISFASGNLLTITYLSGLTTAFGGDPPEVDATGYGPPPSPFIYVANNNLGSSGTFFPSAYINAADYPIYLNALVGAFTDSTGDIIGSPFAVNDGPGSFTVPAGATQLQLGINDDVFFNNSGSLSVEVSGRGDGDGVPEPATFILLGLPLIAIGYWGRRTRRSR